MAEKIKNYRHLRTIVIEIFHFLLAGLEMVLETQQEDYLTTELDKQKRKLKDIRQIIDQQHQLLRLIVQVKGRSETYFEDLNKYLLFSENGNKNRGR